MHGGASPKGFVHPCYQHGRYSKYSLEGQRHRAAVEKRRELRARRDQLRKMSNAELRGEARRMLGEAWRAILSIEEVRAWLVASCESQIRTSLEQEASPFRRELGAVQKSDL